MVVTVEYTANIVYIGGTVILELYFDTTDVYGSLLRIEIFFMNKGKA